MYYRPVTNQISLLHSLNFIQYPFERYESAYAFDCTYFRLICLQDVGKEREQERKLCLTAKALRRMAGFCSCKTSILYVLYITMRSFLVGATEPKIRTLNMPFFVNDSRCKRVQLRFLG
jgi:hypothetical protein